MGPARFEGSSRRRIILISLALRGCYVGATWLLRRAVVNITTHTRTYVIIAMTVHWRIKNPADIISVSDTEFRMLSPT